MFPLKLLHIFDERELEVSYIRVVVISQPGDVQGIFTRPLHTVVVQSVQSALEQFWLIFGIVPQKMGNLELKGHPF